MHIFIHNKISYYASCKGPGDYLMAQYDYSCTHDMYSCGITLTNKAKSRQII